MSKENEEGPWEPRWRKMMPDGTEFVDPESWPEGLDHNLVMPEDGPAYIQKPFTNRNMFEWCERNGVDYGEINPEYMGLPADYPEMARKVREFRDSALTRLEVIFLGAI